LSRQLPARRRALLEWGAAALAAAALFFLPWLIVAALNGDLHGWWIAVLGGCAAALVLHVRLRPEPASRAALWLVLTEAALLVGLVGLTIELVATDSCGASPAVNVVRWTGAPAIYLIGGAWGLQRPLRGLWALPLAALVAGGWLVAAAHLVPGGDGTSCFN
jgi:hypothetical protein